MKKRSARSAWIVCFVVVLCSVTQARIRIQGPADQQMLFLEMLQCAMYGTAQPAPGQIVADAMGNLSLAPSSIPPTNVFGKQFLRILNDTTNTVNVFLEKEVPAGGSVFGGAYRRGQPTPATASCTNGNGEQSIDVCDLKLMTKNNNTGALTQQAAAIHELTEAWIALRDGVNFKVAHDSALVAEYAVIKQQNGGMEYQRFDVVKENGRKCIKIIYKKVGATDKKEIKFYINDTLQVDSIKYGLINTLKRSYITNGIGQGLWQFDQSDAGNSDAIKPGTDDVSGSGFLHSDGQGNLFVSLPLDGFVLKFSYDGNVQVYQNAALSAPKGLAFDVLTDKLYVADGINENIAVFADSGTFLQALNLPGLNLPEGLALDAEGNLFVASHGSDSIFHLNPTGDLINKFSHPDLQAPAGLAFDFYMQELYVVSNSNNQVLVFHQDGSFARTFAQGTVLNSPWGIALRGGYLPPEWGACTLADKLQQVVIANSGTQQLLIYNPDGSLQDSLKNTQASPTGVALELFSQSTTIDGIEDFSPKTGNKISLKVYPNPFAKDVNISYDLPSSTNVRLDIFTLEGRQVRTLVNERLGAGFQTHTWDGTNESGKKLSTGFYQILLQTDRNSGTSRILLLR